MEVKVDDSLNLKNVGCPLNFVKAKLKLEQLQDGQILEVIIDDGEPIRNVPRAIKEEGHKIVSVDERSDGTFRLLIRKAGGRSNG